MEEIQKYYDQKAMQDAYDWIRDNNEKSNDKQAGICLDILRNCMRIGSCLIHPVFGIVYNTMSPHGRQRYSLKTSIKICHT